MDIFRLHVFIVKFNAGQPHQDAENVVSEESVQFHLWILSDNEHGHLIYMRQKSLILSPRALPSDEANFASFADSMRMCPDPGASH